MRGAIDRFLAEQAAIILDGGLATELERRGADLRDPLWSARCLIDHPSLIRAVHRDYFEAGADVATTATYQATFEALRGRGLDDGATARLMSDAVALATSARDDFWQAPANREGRLRPLVAASVGPYGAMLADGSEYRGEYGVSDRTLRDFHRPRLRVLARSDADLLAFETIPCLREALVLAQLLQEFPTRSAWLSFSCRDGNHDCEGEDVGACAAALQAYPQIAAIGVNCTRPEHLGSLLRRMRSRTSKPLAAYPNSGEDFDAAAKSWHGHPQAGAFAVQSRGWYADGARLIGGCCRTGPGEIAAISSWCRALRPLPAGSSAAETRRQ